MAPAPRTEHVDTPDNNEFQPPAGVIIPPKDIRNSVEKTAGYIARNGFAFEGRLRDTAKDKPALQFIFPDNPYNPYYLWRLEEIKDGRGSAVAAGREGEIASAKKNEGPAPPPDFHFSARMPNINAVDLEVVKLTALFVAKNGRAWMTSLANKEGRNYQFDFLRPQHSFHQYFSRLTDQYIELLSGDTVEGSKKQDARIKELERNVQDKFNVLERARKRGEWVKYQEAQKVQKQEQNQADDIAYHQIDWHDFVVAETILFTEADDHADLPPPTSLNDLQSASLEQKAAMTLAPSNMRIEETMPGMEDYQQPQAQIPPPPSFYDSSQTFTPPPSHSFAPPPPFHRSAQEQEEDARIQERAAERERAEQAQAAARATGPMRIRNDYVPRAQARRQNVTTALCPNCRQQVPYNELEQHMKSKPSL